MSEPITLQEFVELIEDRIRDFGYEWAKNHRKDSENWPSQMEFADWNEQFTVYQIYGMGKAGDE